LIFSFYLLHDVKFGLVVPQNSLLYPDFALLFAAFGFSLAVYGYVQIERNVLIKSV
jgi:hypothetical protein